MSIRASECNQEYYLTRQTMCESKRRVSKSNTPGSSKLLCRYVSGKVFLDFIQYMNQIDYEDV